MRSTLNDGGVVGGIVLCGGHSRRMGFPKADLPFEISGNDANNGGTLLAHVVRVLSEVVGPIVVVSAAGQLLPKLPDLSCEVLFAHDRNDSRGPMEGLAAGMLQLETGSEPVEAAFVTGCDMPLLHADFVRHMIGQLRPEDSIAVPRCERFYHPLAAVYRLSTLSTVQRLLAHDLLRTGYLFDQLPTNEVSTESLRAVDPELSALEQVNTPEQYLAILERCGQQPTAEVMARFEALRASREGKLGSS